MESEIPSWLDKEFIRAALQGRIDVMINEKIILESINIDKPVAKGENYVCEIFRAIVKYRQQNDNDTEPSHETSFIIKAPFVGGLSDTILDVIHKEIRIYYEYIPKINKILLPDQTLNAKLFYSSKENVLVLEDLKFKGFVVADRRLQLDYDHTVIALKALAALHAASVKLHEDEPEFVEEIGNEIFFTNNGTSVFKEYVEAAFLLMAEETKSIPELERYTEQLKNYSEISWELLVHMLKPKGNSFNALNHGDFWITNMLFQYNELNNPIKMLAIDFQESRFTKPTIDLLYLLYSSVQDEVRIKKTIQLLDIYLDEINKNLDEFDADRRLTKSQLNSMMDECEFFGLFVTISLYPIVTSDPINGVMDLSEVTLNGFKHLENNPLAPYYKSRHYIPVISKRFAEFEDKGWF